jgi:hypothetical protein
MSIAVMYFEAKLSGKTVIYRVFIWYMRATFAFLLNFEDDNDDDDNNNNNNNYNNRPRMVNTRREVKSIT